MHGHDAGDGEEYGRKIPLVPRRGKDGWSWEYCTNILAHSRCLYRCGCGGAHCHPSPVLEPSRAGGSQARGRRWPSGGCIFCLQFDSMVSTESDDLTTGMN